MIEEFSLGYILRPKCAESLGLGIYYRKSPRSIQKHWDAGRVVQCVRMKMYNVYCYCEPHPVKITETAGQLNWHSVVLDIQAAQLFPLNVLP